MTYSHSNFPTLRATRRTVLNHILILFAVVMMAACSLNAQEVDPDTQIRATVLYPDSSPVPGFVLRCNDKDEIYEVITDKNGIAIFKLEDTKKDRIVQMLIGDGTYLDLTESEMQKYVALVRSIFDLYYSEVFFRKGISVPVSAGLTTDIEFKFVHTSRVSGRAIIQTSDTPLELPICFTRNSIRSISKLQRDGSFSLAGIPTQQNNELYFWAYPKVYIASITSKQMNQQNVDVGLIKFKSTELPANAKLDIEVHSVARERYSRHTWSPGITMIHESGEVIYSFWDHNGQLRVLPTRVLPPLLPAGRYWLAPGHFGRTDLQLAIIDGVRSGLIDENSDLKTIVLLEGETTTGTIIHNEVADLIIKFIEKTGWKRENVPQINKSDDE